MKRSKCQNIDELNYTQINVVWKIKDINAEMLYVKTDVATSA